MEIKESELDNIEAVGLSKVHFETRWFFKFKILVNIIQTYLMKVLRVYVDSFKQAKKWVFF